VPNYALHAITRGQGQSIARAHDGIELHSSVALRGAPYPVGVQFNSEIKLRLSRYSALLNDHK
jgi:hypothetical protein